MAFASAVGVSMPLAQSLVCARPLAPPRGGRPAAARFRQSAVRVAADAAAPAAPAGGRKHPNSQWPTGVPPKMGEHVLASGRTAPVSVSTGCGTGAPHMFQYHAAQTPVNVEARPLAPAILRSQRHAGRLRARPHLTPFLLAAF